MSVAQFEIVYDETIQLLDENNENILLRMISIKNKYIMLDSKKRFYIIGCQNPQIENFYYKPSGGFGLKYVNSWVAMISGNFYRDRIIKYFYDNRDEYWPSNGLSNFELK